MLSLLFVCTGNICRSPLAEAFAADRSRRLLDGAVRVDSAGTWADDGRLPMPETVTVAGERNLDLSRKRANALAGNRIESADLIVTMTGPQRREVVTAVPEAAEKTFTLKELAGLLSILPPVEERDRDVALARLAEADRARSPEFDGDIRDPIGMPLSEYRDVAREIELGVDAIFQGLFGAREPQGARGTG